MNLEQDTNQIAPLTRAVRRFFFIRAVGAILVVLLLLVGGLVLKFNTTLGKGGVFLIATFVIYSLLNHKKWGRRNWVRRIIEVYHPEYASTDGNMVIVFAIMFVLLLLALVMFGL